MLPATERGDCEFYWHFFKFHFPPSLSLRILFASRFHPDTEIPRVRKERGSDGKAGGGMESGMKVGENWRVTRERGVSWPNREEARTGGNANRRNTSQCTTKPISTGTKQTLWVVYAAARRRAKYVRKERAVSPSALVVLLTNSVGNLQLGEILFLPRKRRRTLLGDLKSVSLHSPKLIISLRIVSAVWTFPISPAKILRRVGTLEIIHSLLLSSIYKHN